MNGTLYLCPTPIGNLEDITLRTLRILKEADLIAAEDTRHSLKLLNHFDIKKPMISYFEHNKRERGEEILKHIRRGENVALITDAGTPAISDPGEELVKQCIEENIDVFALPGANAAITALISSGISTGRFSFQGFLSMNKTARREHLEEVKKHNETLIFYEAPHKLINTLNDMLRVFGDRQIALCRELTKTYEEKIRCTISEALAHFETAAPKGEFVIIISGANRTISDDFGNISLEALYQSYIEQGTDSKEALKTAAKNKGMSKRDAYAALKI